MSEICISQTRQRRHSSYGELTVGTKRSAEFWGLVDHPRRNVAFRAWFVVFYVIRVVGSFMICGDELGLCLRYLTLFAFFCSITILYNSCWIPTSLLANSCSHLLYLSRLVPISFVFVRCVFFSCLNHFVYCGGIGKAAVQCHIVLPLMTMVFIEL